MEEKEREFEWVQGRFWILYDVLKGSAWTVLSAPGMCRSFYYVVFSLLNSVLFPTELFIFYDDSFSFFSGTLFVPRRWRLNVIYAQTNLRLCRSHSSEAKPLTVWHLRAWKKSCWSSSTTVGSDSNAAMCPKYQTSAANVTEKGIHTERRQRDRFGRARRLLL